jgi:outer membrane protein assembly factor BamB
MNKENKNTLRIFIICLTLLLVAAAQPVLGSDWAQFQNDNINSGVTSDSAPHSNISLANWSAKIGPVVETAPVIGDGKVFVVDAAGNISAYSPTGTLAWKNSTIQGVGGSFELATPAYDNGTLYVALSKGNTSTHAEIHAVYTNNGTEKWNNTSLGNYQTNTPVKYSNDSIFFGTCYINPNDPTGPTIAGDYYCFNASTGEFKWKRPSTSSSGYYWAGAAVIGDYLVYGDDKGNLTSVKWNDYNSSTHVPVTADSTNITNLFGSSFSGSIRSSICHSAANGGIYFAAKSGHTFYVGFNTTTGKFKLTGNHKADVGYTSTPAVYNGRVYVGAGGWSDGAKLYCLNADNLAQTPFWTYTGDTGGVQGSPVISADGSGTVYIYFTNNGPTGRLYCLSDAPRQVVSVLQWYYTPDHPQYLLQGPAISNGYVFFGNDAGYFYGLH